MTPAGQGGGAAELDAVWRRDAPRMRAVLTRRLNDLDLAEDALAEAVTIAAQRWPGEGVPANPAGWLVTTAWRAALDQLRRATVGRRKLALLANEPQPEFSDPADDDTLALIFGCCHPAVDQSAQVALTLHAVGGLTTAEIASAFLVPTATLAQRLVRAKHRLRAAGVRFEVPEPQDYPQRLPAVLSVVYLIFNEGYLASSSPQRRDLAREALRLARELISLMPAEPEVAGLVALLELHEARAATRFDRSGRLVLLEEQDRSQWDQALIAEATARLDRALARGAPGTYQLQAAIAAVHAAAPTLAETDWAQIRALHSMLHAMTGNPLVLLNRAVATRYVAGAQTALDEVDALTERLGSYRLFHAVRGELLRALGRLEESRSAVTRAHALATNPAERELLSRRLS